MKLTEPYEAGDYHIVQHYKQQKCLLSYLIGFVKGSMQCKIGAAGILRCDVSRLPQTEQAAGGNSAMGTVKTRRMLSWAWEMEKIKVVAHSLGAPDPGQAESPCGTQHVL